MTPTRAGTRTTRSRVERTNHEATVPPLYRWEVISLTGHAFKLSVDDVELSIREDKNATFHIPWTWCPPVNCELNLFFRIHQSQSTSMKIIISYTWDRWKDRICLQHKSLSDSSCCFPFQIFWRPLLTYLLSPFLDCKPYDDDGDEGNITTPFMITIQLQDHQVKTFQWRQWTGDKRRGQKLLKHF